LQVPPAVQKIALFVLDEELFPEKVVVPDVIPSLQIALHAVVLPTL
jgi:hypothetical protein